MADERSMEVRRGAVRQSIVDIMHELGTELPWSVLSTLAAGNQCVGKIAQSLGIPQTYVSKSLHRLSALGLVRYSREGNRHIYHINQEQVALDSNGELEIALRSTDGSRIAMTFSVACLQTLKFPPPPPRATSHEGNSLSRSASVNRGKSLRDSPADELFTGKRTAHGRQGETTRMEAEEHRREKPLRSRRAKSRQS